MNDLLVALTGFKQLEQAQSATTASKGVKGGIMMLKGTLVTSETHIKHRSMRVLISSRREIKYLSANPFTFLSELFKNA